MSIVDILTVLSFALACFMAGYTLGTERNTQK